VVLAFAFVPVDDQKYHMSLTLFQVLGVIVAGSVLAAYQDEKDGG
jgi:hypothetical protein